MTVARSVSVERNLARLQRTADSRLRQIDQRFERAARDDVFRIRTNSLEPWLAKLDADRAAGCRKGAELWRRLRIAGFGGSLRVATEWATACPTYAAPASRWMARPERGRRPSRPHGDWAGI